MKYNLISVYLLLSISTLGQTTVIVRVTEKAIFAGADSRLFKTYTDFKSGKTDTTFMSICKIHTFNKLSFAISGKFASANIQFAKISCLKKATSDVRVDNYAKSFQKFLTDTMHYTRKNMPNLFNEMINNHTINKIVFFWYENNIPKIKHINFYITDVTPDNYSIGYTVGSLNPKSKLPTNITLGHTKHIDDLINKESTWKDNVIKVINRLIKIEEKADRLAVGGDIDIIKVSPSKIDWIQKKKICN